jgi:hypothetical protein
MRIQQESAGVAIRTLKNKFLLFINYPAYSIYGIAAEKD